MAILRTTTSQTASAAVRRQVNWAEPLAAASANQRAAHSASLNFPVLRGRRPPFQEFQWHAADLNRVNNRPARQVAPPQPDPTAEPATFFDEAAALVSRTALAGR